MLRPKPASSPAPRRASRPASVAPLVEVRRLVKTSSVTRVIDLVGDRSTLRVLQEVFAGWHRFDELQKSTGIARNTLTNRLLGLVKHRVLARAQYQNNPPRSEYRLTARGQELYGVLLHVGGWERRWSGDMAGPMLVHSRCGHELQAALACAKCRKTIDPRQMVYLDAPASGHGVARRRHQRRARGLHTADDGTTLNAADILGDWWTALVLSLTFFGVRRFKDMQDSVGIAPNILSSRLAHLTACGLLRRAAYQSSPPRFEYRLTEKGLDLYPMLVAMMGWGDRWLSPGDYASLILKHLPCGSLAMPRTVCGACGREVRLDEVRTGDGGPWGAA